jgi:hypothetical protein
MRSRRLLRRRIIWMALGGLGLLLVLSAVAPAQEEVTTSVRRYKDRESSTGYYEEYEAKPRRTTPFIATPKVIRPSFGFGPRAAQIGLPSFLADAHRGVQFYNLRTCVECHPDEAKNNHTIRGNLTCRQCHGGEPIASIAHYYSPMNPVRRHAYVCSKCHEGSSMSFATYVVHEPKPGSLLTRKTFPSLFYADWFMYLLVVGTIGFFFVHTMVWVSKEFYHVVTKKEKKPQDEKPEDEKVEDEKPPDA